MKTLTEIERASVLIDIDAKMSEFINDNIPDEHQYGYIPENLSMLMAKAALAVLETVVDCNVYFEENPSS